MASKFFDVVWSGRLVWLSALGRVREDGRHLRRADAQVPLAGLRRQVPDQRDEVRRPP